MLRLDRRLYIFNCSFKKLPTYYSLRTHAAVREVLNDCKYNMSFGFNQLWILIICGVINYSTSGKWKINHLQNGFASSTTSILCLLYHYSYIIIIIIHDQLYCLDSVRVNALVFVISYNGNVYKLYSNTGRLSHLVTEVEVYPNLRFLKAHIYVHTWSHGLAT